MLSKIKTLAWYLVRPHYYSQLISLIRFKLQGEPGESDLERATEWSAQHAVSRQEALSLLGVNNIISPIEEVFKDEFTFAKEQEKKCSYKMGGEGDINLLYSICQAYKVKKVIETGVAYGWSSLAILLSIAEREGKLISTDMPYPKMGNEDFVGTVVPPKLKKYWELIRYPDRKGLPIALRSFNNAIDLCHYDSDKSYDGRMYGYPLLWEALKDGGVFISDDISDNFGFRDFCDKIGKNPIIVEHLGKYVGILVKTP